MEIHEAVPFQSFSRVYKFRLQFLAEYPMQRRGFQITFLAKSSG